MSDNTPTRTAATVHLTSLHASLRDPTLDSMNLLNEIAQRYPDALSFAAGRPHEGEFAVDDVHRYLRAYCRHLRSDRGWSEPEVASALFQYGRTKGIVHDLVASNLAADEGIHVDPESIVITVGWQEAVFITLRALRADERDVVLAVSPTYVGFTGAARLVDMRVLPVESGADGIDLEHLAMTTRAAVAAGLRPRALYIVPDFSNPTGISLDLDKRRQLLSVAADLDLLVLEDNPYGLFSAGSQRLPTLKALDTQDRVVYLGTYAKSALPGVRIGYAVAPQRVLDASGADAGCLADQLSKVKSMVTVNTPPVAQAVLAGMLLENGGTLVKANAERIEIYRRNLRLVLDGLEQRFPPGKDGHGVTWNVPGGGFFLVATVPFVADDAMLEHSARRHAVLWTPMHHFYQGIRSTRKIRLSYSSLEPDQIERGLDRIADLVHEQAECAIATTGIETTGAASLH